MSHVSPVVRLLLLAALTVSIGAAWLHTTGAEAEDGPLTVKGVVPFVAKDGPPTSGSGLPGSDGSYCGGGTENGTVPPNTVFGLLNVGGQPVPAGAVVQVTFDGKAGPARYTTAAGGYRVTYAAGPSGCANQVGARIGILVNGTAFDTGVMVGDAAANPVLRYDING